MYNAQKIYCMPQYNSPEISFGAMKSFPPKLSETLFSEIHAIFSQSIRIYRCKTLKSVTLLPSPTLMIKEDSPQQMLVALSVDHCPVSTALRRQMEAELLGQPPCYRTGFFFHFWYFSVSTSMKYTIPKALVYSLVWSLSTRAHSTKIS